MIPLLRELTALISSFPGIGQKSATRISFYLLRQSDQYINNLVDSIKNFHNNVEFCLNCGVIKSTGKECSLCNSTRDQSLICVVEQPSDAFTIENSGDYHGLYHVLMGCLSPLDGIGPESIRLQELKSRILANPSVIEVIIATNPSIEGNATANYIFEDLQEIPNIKISRIAMGLAIGSQIEFADSKIISQSIKNRTQIF
ncbi:MAG: recombination mediator RecR [Spirochaetia bacterium]|nr:recombination mediator RecR [Spirochaetia bacterium]